MEYRNKKRVAEIKIVEYSKTGNGIGFIEQPNGQQFQVQVPFTMPGDVVRALLLRKRGGVYLSLLEEIVQPSKDRIKPQCVHFAVCGGCRWQHIPYEMQTNCKEGSVRQAFAHLLNPDIDFRPIITSDQPWQYRNKMEFSFSSNAAKTHFLGLVMDSGKGKVLNLTECHLVDTWYLDVLKSVREWWNESGLDSYHASTNTGSLRTLTLREGKRTGDRMAMLTVSGNPEFSLQKHHLDSFVAFIKEAAKPSDPNSKLSIFLRIQQVGKGMPTNFYEMLLYGPDHIREILHIQLDPDEKPVTLKFNISPVAFFQPNTLQAEKLYSTALQMAQIPKNGIVYDLYCGTGTLGICAAKHAKEVVGIELSPESALDARTNASQNGLSNVTILSGAVRHVLSQMQQEHRFPEPDIVMVDPPRPGLDPDALKQLIALNPAKILYVSCNPVTQAANITELLEHGYRIVAIQPIDQFPQTYHIENIVVLTRSGH